MTIGSESTRRKRLPARRCRGVPRTKARAIFPHARTLPAGPQGPMPGSCPSGIVPGGALSDAWTFGRCLRPLRFMPLRPIEQRYDSDRDVQPIWVVREGSWDVARSVEPGKGRSGVFEYTGCVFTALALPALVFALVAIPDWGEVGTRLVGVAVLLGMGLPGTAMAYVRVRGR